jgi:hypothetical protein
MHAFSLSKRVLHFLGFKESASLVLLSLTERDETFIGTKLSDRDCTSEDQFLLRRILIRISTATTSACCALAALIKLGRTWLFCFCLREEGTLLCSLIEGSSRSRKKRKARSRAW